MYSKKAGYYYGIFETKKAYFPNAFPRISFWILHIYSISNTPPITFADACTNVLNNANCGFSPTTLQGKYCGNNTQCGMQGDPNFLYVCKWGGQGHSSVVSSASCLPHTCVSNYSQESGTPDGCSQTVPAVTLSPTPTNSPTPMPTNTPIPIITTPPPPPPPPPGGTGYDDCAVTTAGTQVLTLACIPTLVRNIITFGLDLVGAVCLIIIIFSGIKFILARGDPKEIILAKNALIYAVVGLLVVLLAFLVVNVISTVANVPCINYILSDFSNCKPPG